MAYIGKQPVVGNFQVCDAITVVNGQAAYTMQVSSANVEPENANHMLVSLNGILQKPGSSFTISGSTITFASNLATGDVIDFIILLGNVLDIGAPSDGTVTNAKLAQDIISAETALTAEPADTDEFLVSDAGTLKRIDYSLIKGGGITVAGQWRHTSNFTGSATTITSNWEENDTTYARIGSAMSESSGIFTFASTGLYLITFFCSMQMDANGDGSSPLVDIEFLSKDPNILTGKLRDVAAIWETEPKIDEGLDIYYEASSAYPFVVNEDTNELLAPVGSRVEILNLEEARVGEVIVDEDIFVQEWLTGTKVSLTSGFNVKDASGSTIDYDGKQIRFYKDDGSFVTLRIKPTPMTITTSRSASLKLVLRKSSN